MANDTVEARLARLEREQRRLKSAVAVGLVVAAALLLMGQAPPRTVTARRFVVRGAGGVELGAFGETAYPGEPELELHDAAGKFRVGLRVDPVGVVSVLLEDRRYEETAELTVGTLSGPGVKLLLDGGPLVGGVKLGADRTSLPAMELETPSGRPAQALRITTDTTGAMVLTDLSLEHRRRF